MSKTSMRIAFENARPLRGGSATANIPLVKRIIKALEGGAGVVRSGYKGKRERPANG